MTTRKMFGLYRSAKLFAGILLLSGCVKAPSYKVATAANDYAFLENRYNRDCVEATVLPEKSCDAAFKMLNQFKQDLESANEAVKRGGALKLHLSALKADAQSIIKSGISSK